MFGILIYKQLQAETHKLERNKCSKCLWGHVTHVCIWTCYRNILVICFELLLSVSFSVNLVHWTGFLRTRC